jgi:hypothetical protein
MPQQTIGFGSILKLTTTATVYVHIAMVANEHPSNSAFIRWCRSQSRSEEFPWGNCEHEIGS